MLVDGKRKEGFEVWRRRGVSPPQYHLILRINSRTWPHVARRNPRARGPWELPLESGGQLACTPPSYADCYEVSFRQLPEAIKAQVRRCIQHIETHGTPHENDESVFA